MSNAWYPHYSGDYGRCTAHLSLAEHGAYRLLLDHYYAGRRPLPIDKSALYKICRAFDDAERVAVDSVIKQFFTLREDGFHNGRADRELAKQAQLKDRLSNSGRRGAHKRWGIDGQTNGHPTSQANGLSMANPHPQPQPESESKAEERTIAPLALSASERVPRSISGGTLPEAAEFERFYSAYPRKENKAAARKAWLKVKPGEVEAVLARLEIFKLGKWKGKDLQYIPHPATWLNNRRWEDELESGATESAREKGGLTRAEQRTLNNLKAAGFIQ